MNSTPSSDHTWPLEPDAGLPPHVARFGTTIVCHRCRGRLSDYALDSQCPACGTRVTESMYVWENKVEEYVSPLSWNIAAHWPACIVIASWTTYVVLLTIRPDNRFPYWWFLELFVLSCLGLWYVVPRSMYRLLKAVWLSRRIPVDRGHMMLYVLTSISALPTLAYFMIKIQRL